MLKAIYMDNKTSDARSCYLAGDGQTATVAVTLTDLGLSVPVSEELSAAYLEKMEDCHLHERFGGNAGIPDFVRFLAEPTGELQTDIVTYKNDRPDKFDDEIHMERHVVVIARDDRSGSSYCCSSERFWFVIGTLREVMAFPSLGHVNYWFQKARDLEVEKARINELQTELDALKARQRFGH